MIHVQKQVSMKRLAAYMLLTFGISWTAWIGWSALPDPLQWPIFYLGVFAPGIVAIWFVWLEGGKGALSALLRRLVHWQHRLRWYVFALGFIASIKLIAAAVHRGIYGTWPEFGDASFLLMLTAAVFSTVIGGQAGEELGWRGYLLPRLSERLGLAIASILLGIVWACWHLPLFYLDGTSTTGQCFPVYLVSVTAISVAMAWLYTHTGGSLLPVMLLHAAVNNTKDIVPSAAEVPGEVWTLGATPIAWISSVLLWLAAGVFLSQLQRGRKASLESALPNDSFNGRKHDAGRLPHTPKGSNRGPVG